MSNRPDSPSISQRLERRILGRHRPAADAPLAGCHPPPRQLELQHGRLDGRQPQGEPAPARVRPRLLLPIEPDGLLAGRGVDPQHGRPRNRGAPTAGGRPVPTRMAGVHGSSGNSDRPGRPGPDDQLGPAAEQSRFPSGAVARPDQPGRRRPAAHRPSPAARPPPATSNSRAESTRSSVPGGKIFVTSFAGTGTRTTSDPASATPPPIVRTAAHTSPIRSPARGRPASLCDAGPAPLCAVPRLLRRPDRRPATLDASAAGLHTLKSIHFIGLISPISPDSQWLRLLVSSAPISGASSTSPEQRSMSRPVQRI